MPANSTDPFKKHLASLNRKLDRVKIIQQSGTKKLSLRATLPPKPGEDKPKQRTLATGAPASKMGSQTAFAKAKRLDAELIEGSFSWKDWDPKVAEKLRPKTIGELSGQILELKRPQVKPLGLRHKYQVPLSKLPQDEFPTLELLRDTIISECSGYPTKWAQYKISYGLLADLAGIPHEFQKLGPRNAHTIKPKSPEDLPSDDLILETWNGIENRLYRILYARIACYGLRPHESWKCTISEDVNDPWCEVPEDTKTGSRIVYPLPAQWYSEMQPWLNFEAFNKVRWRERPNTYLGNRIGQFFERKKLPFSPYILRHAWAVRSARANMSIAAAAKMMGHSEAVHQRTYQQALGRDGLREAWQRIL